MVALGLEKLCYEVAPKWVFIEKLNLVYIGFVWLQE